MPVSIRIMNYTLLYKKLVKCKKDHVLKVIKC